MENIQYLPLGSVVNINGTVKKMIIISRGIVVNIKGGKYFFEYAGCMYPEGMVSSQLHYFNNEDISRVVFEGCKDEMRFNMSDKINDWYKDKNIPKGNVHNLK